MVLYKNFLPIAPKDHFMTAVVFEQHLNIPFSKAKPNSYLTYWSVKKSTITCLLSYT